MVYKTKEKSVSFLGYLIWIFAILFYMYEFFLRVLVGTLAKEIIDSLHLTSVTFSIMGAAYYIVYSLMQMPVGYIVDKFGAKTVIVLATLTCAISAFLFAMTNHFITAFLVRLMMGFGSSFGFVTLLVTVTTWFPKKKQALFIGLSSLLGGMGPLIAAGPVTTYITTSGMSWRVLLFQIGVLGLILSGSILIFFKSKPRGGEQAMVFLNKKEKISTILKRLLKNPQAWFVGFFTASIFESADFLGAIWGNLYLQSRSLNFVEAGYIVSALWLGNALGGPVAGWTSDKMNRRKPQMIFSSLLGLVLVILAVYFPFNTFLVYLFLFFFIGFASATYCLGIATIVEHVHSSVKAIALGLNNSLVILFGALLPPLASTLIHISNLDKMVPRDFQLGFLILPLLFLSSLILSIFFIKETYCKPQREMIILDPM